MNPAFINSSFTKKSINKTFHFWVLLIITLSVTLLYYSWVFLSFRPHWFWLLISSEFNLSFSGTLYYIPMIYTAVLYGWKGILYVWLISLTAIIPLDIYFGKEPVSIIINILYLSVPLILISYITLEISWRNKERKALSEREAERQSYVSQILQAQEDERQRIARELHDDTLHSLLIIANRVNNIKNGYTVKTRSRMKQYKESIRNDIFQITEDLRRLSLDLRPGILDNAGFLPALKWLIYRLNKESHINARIVIKGEEQKIPSKTDTMIFRIVQEGLNNILIHSEATEATVTLIFEADKLKVIISDNGRGFIVSERINHLASSGKFGLMGIQERVHALNGAFNINSANGKGTTISVEIKL